MSDSPPAAIRTVLVTDLVDSTHLLATLGDAAASELFGRHDRLARDLIERSNGIEIDKSDGFLLLFAQPLAATRFALAYHEALREFSLETGQQWRARVGIQQGEVYLFENRADDVARGAKRLEVEGLVKAVAARLMHLAQPSQTLVGAVVFDQAQRGLDGPGQPALGWLAHGRYRFKGVDEPVAVFEVGAPGLAPLLPPADNDKARRDVTADEQRTLGWRPGPKLEVPGRPHWRLRRKLGTGGFGEAWLAEHDQSRAQRVFKFCHHIDLLRSLKREVTVFRLLRDSLGERADIARIIDWQLEQAPFFLESEYIDGGDLCRWADAHGGLALIPRDQRLAIAAQVCEALAAAHSVGVLHKDIKPANVLVRRDAQGQPQALLADFGIGSILDRRPLLERGITAAGLTEFESGGVHIGSQLYLAPELLAGKPASVRSDLYSLGVLLYELAAGEFKALAPGWQRDVDDALLRADIAALVDGDPERRPSDADSVARELREFPARQAAHSAAQAHDRRRAGRWLLAHCCAAALGLFVLLCAGLLYARNHAHQLVEQEIRARMMGMAETATVFVDPAVHRSFYEPELVSEDDPTWRRYEATFQRLLAQNRDFAYLYTAIRRDGRYYFIIDGTPADDVENATALMELYTEPDASLIQAFDSGAPVISLTPYRDKWGEFISAFVPLKDARGATYAVLGVDMHYATYLRLLEPVDRMARTGFLIAAVICLATGLLLFLLRRQQRTSGVLRRQLQASSTHSGA